MSFFTKMHNFSAMEKNNHFKIIREMEMSATKIGIGELCFKSGWNLTSNKCRGKLTDSTKINRPGHNIRMY